MSRPYPDEPVGPFERPPIGFTDAHGRAIDLSVYDGEFAALREMYVGFDPADRAQGIPPANEAAIDAWLDTILATGYDVVAFHGDACVGHATLVADAGETGGASRVDSDARDEPTYELAIFVLDTHQAAGIGSRLLAALLGHAGREGVERVWLTVERWNRAAIALYRSVGFETCDAESFELEMSLRL